MKSDVDVILNVTCTMPMYCSLEAFIITIKMDINSQIIVFF